MINKFNNSKYELVYGYLPKFDKNGNNISNVPLGTGGRRTSGGQMCSQVVGLHKQTTPMENKLPMKVSNMSMGKTIAVSAASAGIVAFTIKATEYAYKNRHKIVSKAKNMFSKFFKTKGQDLKKTEWIDMEIEVEENAEIDALKKIE